jgi:hypothetical protein
LDVEVVPNMPLLKLCSFAAWLPRYAALVKSITIHAGAHQTGTVNGLSAEQYTATVHQLLQPAFHLARLLPVEAAAAAGHAASHIQPAKQQQQHGLQLERFCSHLPRSADLLAVLPAHSFTALDLEFDQNVKDDGGRLSALLGQLSSLQQLRLSGVYPYSSIPGSCLANIACLSQLTALTLEGYWRQVEKPLQQLLAQRC